MYQGALSLSYRRCVVSTVPFVKHTSLAMTENHQVLQKYSVLASPMVEPLSLLESNMDEKFDCSNAELYTDLSENVREWI